MKYIFRNFLQYKKSVLCVVFLLAVQAYCDLSLPRYMADLVDVGILQIGSERQQTYLWQKGLAMLALSVLMMVAAMAVSYLAAKVGASIGRDLRERFFRKVMTFSNTEVDRFTTASLITRSTNDIRQVQMVSIMLLRMVAFAPIMGVGGIVMVALTRSDMSWIICIALALLFSVVFLLMHFTLPKFKKMQVLIDRVNLIARELLTGLPVIRAFHRTEHETQRFEKANRELKDTQLFTNRAMTMMMPSMMLIMDLMSILIIFVGAEKVQNAGLQVGEMMAFITYTMQIIMSFLMLSMVSVMLPRAGVAASRIFEVLETNPVISDGQGVQKTEWTGQVCFSQVYFRYPAADANVLENISFIANPGEITALVGSTGSGKSTILQLLMRFYDVSSGNITVDGVDIRNMTIGQLRDIIGYVPQRGILFSGTIASNIKFANAELSDEEMEHATQIAQAVDFINNKPMGFQSDISQSGTNVSGGQKQRLAIARAIAKQPKIYLFDDSFSALDQKTDAALRKALFASVKDATVIIVAQRISTILHADRIIVLEEGKIVGQGTHEQLMESCTAYREIAESQLSKRDLNGGGLHA